MKVSFLNILLPGIILLTFGFQCVEEAQYTYQLELPFDLSPVQKEYHTGDTIQISAIINGRSLSDLSTQGTVEIVCNDIPVTFYVGVRHSNYNLLNDVDLFDIIVDTLNIRYDQLENNGQFSRLAAYISESVFDKEEIAVMKLVLKRKGIFMLYPYPSYMKINRAMNCDSIYPTVEWNTLNYLFDVADSNPELLAESPLPQNVFIEGDRVPGLTEQKRIFWFKVIE